MSIFYKTAVTVSWVYGNLFCNVQVLGKKNIPRNEGFLLIANHLSYFDPFLIAHPLDRIVHFMAMSELYRNPFSSYVMNAWHTIPVKRGTADRTAIASALELLKRDKIVGIFPQGGIRKDNATSELQAGAAMLALQSGCKILPVQIEGTRHLYRPIVHGRPKIIISFKQPFDLAHVAGSDKREQRHNAIKEIERHLRICANETN